MSLIKARKKRTTLYLSVAGLMVMVAAISAISARDPSGVSVRIGMIMVTVGAALWLPWRQLIPAVLIAWLAPNLARNLVDDTALLNLNMILELPGLAGVAFFTVMAREALKELEQENVLLGQGDLGGVNGRSSVFEERQLRPMLEAELARARRFGHSFALMLVGIDEMRQKYDYRDESLWRASLDATTRLLRETRLNVDRVFHHGDNGFAMILPESNEEDIPGLVKRLRRLARQMKPAEGEPGGPLPVHFGATFFPDCATTVDDLLRRAEVALKIASSNTTRYQLDSAEAPELPPAETLRRPEAPAVSATEPPPAVSNPVAAAIVGEAYAERAREAEAAATPAVDAVEAVRTAEEAVSEPEAVPEPVVAAVEPTVVEEQAEVAPAPAAELEKAFVAEAPVTASEPVVGEATAGETSEPSAGFEAAGAERVAEPEPVLVGAYGSTVGEESQPLAAPVSAAANVADDFEALLKQMDETLKMIKSVRNSAA